MKGNSENCGQSTKIVIPRKGRQPARRMAWRMAVVWKGMWKGSGSTREWPTASEGGMERKATGTKSRWPRGGNAKDLFRLKYCKSQPSQPAAVSLWFPVAVGCPFRPITAAIFRKCSWIGHRPWLEQLPAAGSVLAKI
jgi:hypothetical protein